MKISEELSWILDKDIKKPKGFISILVDNDASREFDKLIEQDTQLRIDFAHSLGQKCDSVGWSNLDLNSCNAESILDAIKNFCTNNNYKARGYYARTFEEIESDWFLLKSRDFSNDEWGYADIVDQKGSQLHISELKAYKIPKGTAAIWDRTLPQVSEGFMKACIDNNLPGIEFYWLRDIGKYQATQFFNVMPTKKVPYIACDRYLDYTGERGSYRKQIHKKGSVLHKRLIDLGGKLPLLSEIFYDLTIRLPDYYPKNEMPDAGFAYAYFSEATFERNNLLIHKKSVETLLNEKAISEGDITPVLLFDEVPRGYFVQYTEDLPIPAESYLQQLSHDYLTFIQKPRPIRKTTEKQALGLLKKAKAERKSEFRGKLSLGTIDGLDEALYKLLTPYYSIADGGIISDEYCFLSYGESIKETACFFTDLEKEELLQEKLDGVVFSLCADGDIVLLGRDGTVMRISHEVPEIVECWDNLAQFFYDCIEL